MLRFSFNHRLWLPTLALATTLLIAGSWSAASNPQQISAKTGKKVSFSKQVFPLLKARCFRCHQGADASSGVRLDVRDEILGKSNGKPLVRTGKSKKSRLIHMVSGKVPGKIMPRKGPRLSAHEIDLLRRWIDQGLDWDNALLPEGKQTAHWSFRPIASPSPPKIKNREWITNPIDAFVAAKHEQLGLEPAQVASRKTLIRRLYLDLLGLLPTPEEIDAFAGDQSPHAYENLVDRLLKSPHYGERWARHWLDVARWAESEGYESNHLRPFAWRYRDYVIDSFNQDRPYPEFIMQQIAGDEMTPYSDENLIATGFLAAARISSNEEDKWRQRNDMLVDIVNAAGSAFLGLTMNCAQCHNHKFDPITSRDYYRFQGFFIRGYSGNLELKDPELWAEHLGKRPPEYEHAYKLKWQIYENSRQNLLKNAVKKLAKKYVDAWNIPTNERSDEEERLVREAYVKLNFGRGMIERSIPEEDRRLYSELKKKLRRIEDKMPARPQTFGFYSPVTSPHKIKVLPMDGFYPPPYEPKELAVTSPYLLVGGDVNNRGFKVETGWPEVFGRMPSNKEAPYSRLTLAKWLGSAKNPLTARVFVNRIWQYHFGRGIVATPSDFGKEGAKPSHPQLLDWLASEFIRNGWSTQYLHRLIVTSQTYRQSSERNASSMKLDPDNQYLSYWKPRRAESEIIRDIMLCVTGELDREMGGPSEDPDEESMRRSIYVLQKRDRPTEVSALFDGPTAVLESCARRHVSTVPLQGLYLLNNEFSIRCATQFAQRVYQDAGTDRTKQIERAFIIALGRLPAANEMKLAGQFFERHPADDNTEEVAEPLVHFCQALMNLNEFVYLE